MYIGLFDIETTGLDADFGVVLCSSIKDWHNNYQTVFRIDDGPPGAARSDDSHVVSATIEELKKFDILIAHNGVQFDKQYLNSRALRWHQSGLLLPDTKIIDPVKLARNHLRLGYNSLERLAQHLQTPHQKEKIQGPTWVRAGMDRDEDAMNEVVSHCKNDVLVLQDVMEQLRPFIRKIDSWGSAS